MRGLRDLHVEIMWVRPVKTRADERKLLEPLALVKGLRVFDVVLPALNGVDKAEGEDRIEGSTFRIIRRKV